MTATTFNPSDKHANVALSGGNLVAAITGGYYGVRAIAGMNAGKWYWEYTVNVTPTDHIFGIATSSAPLNHHTGYDANGYGYWSETSTGKKFHNDPGGTGVAYGIAFGNTNVISVLFDANARTISFWVNGADQGVAFTGIAAGKWYPTYSGTGGTVTANFGATAWAYSPPAGYAGPIDTSDGTISKSAPAPHLITGFDGAVLTAPAGTLSSAISVQGCEISAPVPTLSMTGLTGEIATFANLFPSSTLSSVMESASTNTAALTAPAPTLSSDAIGGTVATFAGTAPVPTIEVGFQDAQLTAPAPTLDATLLPGRIATVSARATVPILVATMSNPAIITAAWTAPALQLSATLIAGNTATTEVTTRAPYLSASVLTGNSITAELNAVAPIMLAMGYPAYTITAAPTAPASRLVAELLPAVAGTWRTWVLNTRKLVMTEYDNFQFNSYTVFNGKVIAAGSSGVVELGTQDVDGATAISAQIQTGQDSYGTSFHKRVPRIYAGVESDGDLLFDVITPEGGTRTYRLPFNSDTGLQQRRVPVGKGPRSRYWQYGLRNVNGSDFSLDDLLVYPVKLRRRVQ